MLGIKASFVTNWSYHVHCRPVLPEDIFVDCERFMESLLERPQGRTTLQSFFENNDKFVRLLLLSANENFSLSFVYRMLKFVSRTLEICKFKDAFLYSKIISHCTEC